MTHILQSLLQQAVIPNFGHSALPKKTSKARPCWHSGTEKEVWARKQTMMEYHIASWEWTYLGLDVSSVTTSIYVPGKLCGSHNCIMQSSNLEYVYQFRDYTIEGTQSWDCTGSLLNWGSHQLHARADIVEIKLLPQRVLSFLHTPKLNFWLILILDLLIHITMQEETQEVASHKHILQFGGCLFRSRSNQQPTLWKQQ